MRYTSLLGAYLITIPPYIFERYYRLGIKKKAPLREVLSWTVRLFCCLFHEILHEKAGDIEIN